MDTSNSCKSHQPQQFVPVVPVTGWDTETSAEEKVLTDSKVGRLALAGAVAPTQRQAADKLATRVVKVYDQKTGEVVRHISGLEATKKINECLGIAFDVQPDVKPDKIVCEHPDCGKVFAPKRKPNPKKDSGYVQLRLCEEHRKSRCLDCQKALSNVAAIAARAGKGSQRCSACWRAHNANKSKVYCAAPGCSAELRGRLSKRPSGMCAKCFQDSLRKPQVVCEKCKGPVGGQSASKSRALGVGVLCRNCHSARRREETEQTNRACVLAIEEGRKHGLSLRQIALKNGVSKSKLVVAQRSLRAEQKEAEQ